MHVRKQEKMANRLKTAGQTEEARKLKPKQLSRRDTLRIFQYERHLKIDSIKALDQSSESQMEKQFLIQEAIISDKIYMKYGVERDEYNKAVVDHNLKNDHKV